MNIAGMPKQPMNIGGIQKPCNNIGGITKMKDAPNPFNNVKFEKELGRKVINSSGENVIRKDIMSKTPNNIGGNYGN